MYREPQPHRAPYAGPQSGLAKRLRSPRPDQVDPRPVRTRMPGGVAGDAEDQPPRPYADFNQACNVAYWHFASFRCAAKIGRYWSNSGQILILASDGHDANDPTRTFA